MRSRSFRGALSIGLFSAALCGACGDDAGPPEEPTLSRVQTEIFDISCTQASCHSTQTRAGLLILEPGMAYAELLDVTPDNPAAATMGLVLVKAGDPAGSFLIDKLSPPLDSELGDVMPQGTNGIEADRLQIVRDWVAAGALDN